MLLYAQMCVFMYAVVKKCIPLCTQVYFLYNKVYISNIQTYFCILCYTGNVLVYTEVYTCCYDVCMQYWRCNRVCDNYGQRTWYVMQCIHFWTCQRTDDCRVSVLIVSRYYKIWSYSSHTLGHYLVVHMRDDTTVYNSYNWHSTVRYRISTYGTVAVTA